MSVNIKEPPRGAIRHLVEWAKRKPQPHTLRGELADGSKVVVRITNTAQRFTEACKVIVSNRCTAVEALDGAGNVIRRAELESDEDRSAISREKRDEDSLPEWPTNSEMSTMAVIIARSNREAVQGVVNALKPALQTLERIVDRLESRESGYEAAYHALLAQRVEEAEAERAELRESAGKGNGEPNLLEVAATAVAQGLTVRMQEPNGHTKPNGKG